MATQSTQRTQRPQTRTPQRPRPAQRSSSKTNVRAFEMPFETKNLVIIIAGVLTVGLGYLVMGMSPVMSFAALTLAPIILVLGYCVIIPYGIMYGARAYMKQKRDESDRAMASASTETATTP